MPSVCLEGGCRGFSKRSFSWRQISAWALLDFSNSIVMMIIMGQYTTFIVNYIYDDKQKGTNNLMYSNIVISLLTFFTAPPIGALIDSYYIRLPIVIISVIGYSVASIACFNTKHGEEARPVVLQAISIYCFRMNEMVTGAFLPGLCNDRDMSFVSSYGYFIGYVSGAIVTFVCRIFTVVPKGTTNVAAYTIKGYSTIALLVGIIELLSALPPVLMLDNGLPEGEKRPPFTRHTIPDSFKENIRTIRNAFHISKTLTCILLCYILISLGVQSFLSFGMVAQFEYTHADYGVQMSDIQLILAFCNLFTAVISFLVALLSKAISAYFIVIVMLIILIVAITSAFWYRQLNYTDSFNPGYFWFWFVHGMFALSLGPMQATVRGVIGFLTPRHMKGEVFGCMESMIIIGNILGSTVPAQLVYINYWVFFLWCALFLLAGLVFWIFIPVRKEEKIAFERVLAEEEAAKREAELANNPIEPAEVPIDVSDDESSATSSSSASSTSSN